MDFLIWRHVLDWIWRPVLDLVGGLFMDLILICHFSLAMFGFG